MRRAGPAGRDRRAPSRAPTLLLVPALVGLAACSVAGRRTGADALSRLSGGMPDVRVGVAVDAPSVRIDTEGRLELTEEGGRVRARGGGPWTIRRRGRRLEAAGPSTTMQISDAIVVRPVRGRIRVDGTTYYGAVLIRPASSGVTAVNLLDLESYLRGVVPLEIGAGRPQQEIEAVKAQAIAARTYAIRQLGRREDLGFDYYGTVLDQAYGGADVDDPVATKAVEDTRGVIVTYRGEPIEAYYHSTCGGRTAALEEVWSGDPQPYLRSVSDARPGGGYYCEASSRFRWTEEWDEAELLETLTVGLQGRGFGPIHRVQSIEVDGRTESGRAAELVIRTDAGEARVRGDSIRWVLRPEPGRLLNSTLIELEPRGGDHVTGLTVHGSGWGHGIGMCQTGALGRARDGSGYREILSTYYPGTRLVRLYR